MRSKKVRTVAVFFMVYALVISLAAQSGGDFTITKSVISGGTQAASGGEFSVSGTLGQTTVGNDPAGGEFAVNSGFWIAPVSGIGLEADVAPRPLGDNSILSNDVVQVRRYFNATSIPDAEINEFQRADSAPRATSGDGLISSNDIVQARRYQNGTDIQQSAAGPLFEGATSFADSAFDPPASAAAGVRELRVESTNASTGQNFTLNIRVDATGDEAEYGFRLNYESAKLSNPVIGAGNAGASVRACNTAVLGVVNCSVGGFPNNNPTSTDPGIGEIAAGNDQILITVTFSVNPNASSGASPLTLTNVNTSNDNADLLPITATNGSVNIMGPTAAQVSVGGRVLTFEGRPIVRAGIYLTDLNGQTRVAMTNPFGYYRFEQIEVGHSYLLTVSAKQYEFSPNSRFITPVDVINDADFIALPQY